MPSLLTIQPSNADNFNEKDRPTLNYGTATVIEVDGRSSRVEHLLIRFDFSALPVGAVISAATLNLYYCDSNNAVGRTLWVNELTQIAWTELGSTWNTYDGVTNWATTGGDFTATDAASCVVPAAFGWMSWNVLALVQHFQSTHAEIANFLIKDSDESIDTNYTTYFYSNNYAVNTTLCPKLIITYVRVPRMGFVNFQNPGIC